MAPGPDGGTPLRLGIFGGTFDPPHVGHVAVARDVADALGLDQVLWMPAGIPPHKLDAAVTPPGPRLAMVEAAAAADPRFTVSDVELVRHNPSYTVDTLRHLRKVYPDAQLFLLLGADQLRTLKDGWREPEEILRLAVPALMDREGEPAREAAPDLPGMERAVHVPVTRVDVSATAIRAGVAAGEDVAAWLPPGVMDVIRREGLYGG